MNLRKCTEEGNLTKVRKFQILLYLFFEVSRVINSFWTFRKAAQKWHPDNFQGEEKKMAEKKFIDIAAAKEVLTDPGMG